MTTVKRPAFPLLVILALIAPARAQEDEPPITTDVVAVLLAEREAPDLFFRDVNGDFQPFRITPDDLGRPNTVPRGARLELFHEVTTPEGETVKQAVFGVDLPDSPRAILLFYADSGGRIRTHVLNDPPGNHRGGDGRFVNLTTRRAAAHFNGDTFLVTPKADSVRGPLLISGSRFSFGVALENDGEFETEVPTRNFRLPSEDMRFFGILTTRQSNVETKEGPETIFIPTVVRLYDREPNYPKAAGSREIEPSQSPPDTGEGVSSLPIPVTPRHKPS